MIRQKAKFYVSGVTLLPGQESGVKVDLSAVSRGSRNAEWATATPIGNLSMTVNNPGAAQQWIDFMTYCRDNGKQPELFLDLSPSEDGWPGDGHKFSPSTGREGTCYDPKYCAECGYLQDSPMKYERNPETGVNEGVGQAHPNG